MLCLPANACVLAGSPGDPHQAFRIGDWAWGVQFHSEFSDVAMRFYIDAYEDTLTREGLDPLRLHEDVRATAKSASLLRAIELNGVSVDKNQHAFRLGRYIAHHGAAAVQPLVASVAVPRRTVVQMPESLDTLIGAREALLSAYQNDAYARRYRDVVDRIRAAESRIAGAAGLSLTRAVAANLAKLMAYKDEYEAARLYADPAYLEKLRQQFDGVPGRDYALNFYLAPPWLAKRDEHGHLQKKRFGPWILPAFRVLAKLKGLRGTPLDVFGHTDERRDERRLIADYIALVNEFCATLDAERLPVVLQLASLPDDIRGFGHVKARNVAAAERKRERLLDAYRMPVRSAAIA